MSGALWTAWKPKTPESNKSEVGKDVIEGEIGGKSITDMACKGADFSTGGRRPRRRHRRTHAHPANTTRTPPGRRSTVLRPDHPRRRVVVRNHAHPLAHEDPGHDQQEHRPQHCPLLASRCSPPGSPRRHERHDRGAPIEGRRAPRSLPARGHVRARRATNVEQRAAVLQTAEEWQHAAPSAVA